MDTEDFKLLKEIIDCGSLKKAGEIMKISSSSVTSRVSKMEKDYGYKLMIRNKKGVVLTAAGEAVINASKKIIEVDRELREELDGGKRGGVGEIKIHTSTGAINSWLTEDIIEFLLKYPKVNFNILSTNQPLDKIEFMSDVIIGPLSNRYEKLEKIYIKSYNLKFYASKEYIKKHGYIKKSEDLNNHQLISFSNGEKASFGDVDRFLVGKKTRRKAYLNLNSSVALLKAAEAGLGIILSGGEFLEEMGVELVDIFPREKGRIVDLYYIFRSTVKDIEAVIKFGEFLHKRYNIKKQN